MEGLIQATGISFRKSNRDRVQKDVMIFRRSDRKKQHKVYESIANLRNAKQHRGARWEPRSSTDRAQAYIRGALSCAIKIKPKL